MARTFSVDQKSLLSILTAMQPICSKRTAIDATSSILFQVSHKELILKSTDLEISLQATCAITDSTFDEQEVFLVPGKRIFDLVKELDNEVSCSLDKQKFSLRSGGAYLSLHIKDAESFPAFPERIENLMHFESSFLVELLEKVAFLIPQSNANPSLNGLLLEIGKKGLLMTTTDGHCLAQVATPNCQLAENKQWLLPRRAIFEIKKILENTQAQSVFLGVCNNQLVFSGESFNFFTKLLNDKFPQYEEVLKKDNFTPATLDREQFVKTLRRSVCLLSGQFLSTQFSFDADVVSVSMENKEVGALQEELPLQTFTGEKLDIRFYAPYLLNGLQSFKEKDIKCYLKNSSKPIVFEASSDTYTLTYLVMPVSPSHS